MERLKTGLLLLMPLWLYLGIFQLPYFVWTFPLTQNWFAQNGLVMFRDIIYHHTELPLFMLRAMSYFFGNTPEMLRLSSFLLGLLFSYGIYLLGKQVSQKTANLLLVIFLLSFFPLFHNFNIEEMTASLLTLYATYFFTKFWQNERLFYLLLSGFFLALGIMGKQVMIMILPAYGASFFWFGFQKKWSRQKYLRAARVFPLGVIIGVAPFLLYYLSHQALDDFFYWNITFNLFVYPQFTKPYDLAEGIKVGGWLLFALIPGFYLLFKKNAANFRFYLLLLLTSTLFLSSSFLPSFHAYKILPFYPYPLVIWAVAAQYYKDKFINLCLAVGILIFLFPAKPFYVDYLPGNLFNKEYLLDYGQDELSVVSWLKAHTADREKIMNLGNHYITTLAQRLPQNRYVYLFPWLVAPFEKSSKEILDQPPKYVIVDRRSFEDFPILKTWPFIQYVQTNYQRIATYGTYEIFIQSKK